MKSGRKYYICSSRLGLIREYDTVLLDRQVQQVKTFHDKVCSTSDVHLWAESNLKYVAGMAGNVLLLHCASTFSKQWSILVPHTLQGCCFSSVGLRTKWRTNCK